MFETKKMSNFSLEDEAYAAAGRVYEAKMKEAADAESKYMLSHTSTPEATAYRVANDRLVAAAEADYEFEVTLAALKAEADARDAG